METLDIDNFVETKFKPIKEIKNEDIITINMENLLNFYDVKANGQRYNLAFNQNELALKIIKNSPFTVIHRIYAKIIHKGDLYIMNIPRVVYDKIIKETDDSVIMVEIIRDYKTDPYNAELNHVKSDYTRTKILEKNTFTETSYHHDFYTQPLLKQLRDQEMNEYSLVNMFFEYFENKTR